MKRIFLFTLFAGLSCISSVAQVGNEWIEYGQTYYKFTVEHDGIFRIAKSTLSTAGLDAVSGSSLRLYSMGEQVPVYVSTDGILGDGDYLEFVGYKNRGDFDRRLYSNADTEQLNPYYSMFTDASAYYLMATDAGVGLRVTTVNNNLEELPSVEPFYVHEERVVFSGYHYNPRLQSSVSVAYSHFAEGEGFSSNEQSSHTHQLISNAVYTDGTDAKLTVRFVTANLVSHDIVVRLEGDTVVRQEYSFVKMETISHTVSASDINASMTLDLEDVSEYGKTRISYVNWQYPREFTFGNASSTHFELSSDNTRQYFELNAFAHNNNSPVVYDVASNRRLVSTLEGNLVRFALPPSSSARDIYVGTPVTGISEITSLAPQTFSDWSADNTEYIIISTNSLRTGADHIAAYLNYRRSEAGSGYTAAFYDIDAIIDQFGYGIQKHPQALRNFAQFIASNWDHAKMIFIIGKGIEYPLSRNCQADCQAWFYVPTFGTPGADNLLFTLEGDKLPFIPVGRIPVINSEEIAIYLDKIKEHDQVPFAPQTLEDKVWTKNFLHLGGGADSDQQNQIKSLLQGMENIVESSAFGADVTTYTKSSTSATGESNSDLIVKLLEEGVSVVKFFGHSSANTLDFQINNPKDWNNKGKYPIFSAMGCAAGQIHRVFRSLSEIFVFEPDAGSIAFIAGSGSQYLNALGTWGIDWYSYFGDAFQTTTLGESLKESLRPLSLQTIFTNVILVEQQTLTGDPAIQFYPAAGRDYTWDFESVRFSPDILTTKMDSFDLFADLVNLGANDPDLVDILVEQKLPDGTRVTIAEIQQFIDRYRYTLHLRLPMDERANGLNKFYLTVDHNGLITELPSPDAELNNTLTDDTGREGIDVFILDNRALTTYPPEFAIVTEPNVELVASSTNAFIKGRRFVMELDTTAEFDSPLLNRNTFDQFGGVLKWKVISDLEENTVYYWRVSEDSISTDHAFTWDVSSFLYAPNSDDGWNQSHYYQFLRDDFDGMILTEERQFQFQDAVKNIWIQNAVKSGSIETAIGFIDNKLVPQFFRDWNNTEGNVFVAVVDPITAKTMKNTPGGLYGAINPYTKNKVAFPFGTKTPEDRDTLMRFLTDIIPSGHYVILYTYQRSNEMDYLPTEWAADSTLFGRSIFSVIEEQYPESEIRSLEEKGSVPYTLYYRKDHGVILEQIAADIDATVNVDFNFPKRGTAGGVVSRLIGPARNWDRVEWAYSDLANPDSDSIRIKVRAITQDGMDTLYSALITDTSYDLSEINAATYPFMQLELQSTDDSDERSSPQLNYWRVHYEGEPELVFNPTVGFEFEKDSLQFGAEMRIETVVENVSKYPSTGFLIKYAIIDGTNQSIEVFEEISGLQPGEATTVNYARQMNETTGEHTLVVELNPLEELMELHHFNNFGIQPFFVMRDDRNPVMDVIFDGRHIENGDLVSAHPVIEIDLTDDNAYIPLDDPESFEIFIEYPGAFDFIEIPMNSPEIEFVPGDLSSGINQASVTWRPEFEEEGFYTFKAQGSDAAGNNAGSVFYEVRFEIFKRPLIANLKVFPNPTWGNTWFSFTISGTTTPSDFSLRIIDMMGRVVREFTGDDLNVFVGTHATDVKWDGKTSTGSDAPAGIYLYKIVAKSNTGQEYLQSGFAPLEGKIVLLR